MSSGAGAFAVADAILACWAAMEAAFRLAFHSDKVGEVMMPPHFGQWSLTPAICGGTASLVPQWEQLNFIWRDIRVMKEAI